MSSFKNVNKYQISENWVVLISANFNAVNFSSTSKEKATMCFFISEKHFVVAAVLTVPLLHTDWAETQFHCLRCETYPYVDTLFPYLKADFGTDKMAKKVYRPTSQTKLHGFYLSEGYRVYALEAG